MPQLSIDASTVSAHSGRLFPSESGGDREMCACGVGDVPAIARRWAAYAPRCSIRVRD